MAGERIKRIAAKIFICSPPQHGSSRAAEPYRGRMCSPLICALILPVSPIEERRPSTIRRAPRTKEEPEAETLRLGQLRLGARLPLWRQVRNLSGDRMVPSRTQDRAPVCPMPGHNYRCHSETGRTIRQSHTHKRQYPL